MGNTYSIILYQNKHDIAAAKGIESMANIDNGSSHLLIWVTTGLTILSTTCILSLTLFVLVKMPYAPPEKSALLEMIEKDNDLSHEINSAVSAELLTEYTKQSSKSVEGSRTIIFILALCLLAIIILLGSQMYMWARDRKMLSYWKRAGFLCERLEFLPANRIKLNNLEIELNKTQIETLKKLVKGRCEGKPVHALELGEHGVQTIKRLREELGARFMAQTLIKVRKREGYWIEVSPDCIYLKDPSDH